MSPALYFLSLRTLGYEDLGARRVASDQKSALDCAVDLVLSGAGTVKRSREKAGVGGSIPSLATRF